VGIERELKLRLTAAEAARLSRAAGPAQREKVQINHYLDTPAGELRERHFGLRLREEDDGLRLTLKGPSQSTGDIHQRLEIEADLPATEGRRILDGEAPLNGLPITLPDALAELGPQAIVPLGVVRNLRRILNVTLPLSQDPKAGDSSRPTVALALELDETRFQDGSVDHELELELAPHGAGEPPAENVLATLRAYLHGLGIPWRPRGRGKFWRFLERSGIAPHRRRHARRSPVRAPRRRHQFRWRSGARNKTLA